VIALLGAIKSFQLQAINFDQTEFSKLSIKFLRGANMNVETMSLKQLQTELKKFAKMTKAMGPILFCVRQQMKKQGRKGEGWGAWVEANLHITVRTANTWASDWARANGKMPKTTSGKISRSKQADLYIPVRIPRQECREWFTEAKEKEFHNALVKYGNERAFKEWVEYLIKKVADDNANANALPAVA
jgi:hypothetical protein